MTKLRTLSALGLLALCFCQPVPLTGRQQLNLIPDDQLQELAAQSYREFLNESQVVRGTPDARMVQMVGRNIQEAVRIYLIENDLTDRLQGLDWQFALVKDTTINAFAMPGGKVAVFTGIMPIARDAAGLAVIMGHEIAHVIAQHGNERMSQALLVEFGATALSVALTNEPLLTRRLFLAAYGLGAQVGILLPYSRQHEREADRLGMIFMAMAGYDPREAIDFWVRMERASEGRGPTPPTFLSTHPGYDVRIDLLKEFLPEALQYYRKTHGPDRSRIRVVHTHTPAGTN